MTRQELNEDKQKEIFKEENRQKRKKIIIKVVKIIIIFLIAFYSFFLYQTYIATSNVIVKEKRIINKNIPNSFNGTKIIHFSDLHYGSNIDYKKLKSIVKLINSRNPDLVFFTGDLIDKNHSLNNKEQEKLIDELKDINASLGKYAVSGDEDLDNFTTIMNQSGFIVLNNEYDLLYNKTNDAILLSGFASSINKNIDINKGMQYYSQDTANSNIFSIVITHEPDNTDNILNVHDVDLILSGHSHNGNIRFPYLGTIFTTNGAKKYKNDYYKINNSSLYISSGLGTRKNEIRLFCHPSIYFFRISNS